MVMAHLLGWLGQLGGQEVVHLSQLFHAVVVQILHHLEHGVHSQHISLQHLHQSMDHMYDWLLWRVTVASCRT